MKHSVHYKDFKATLVDDGNYVEGYASVFDNIDHAGEIVERTAWTKTLDPARRRAPIRFLWQHKADCPIGTIEDVRVDQKGLWFRARFDDTQAGQDARKALLSGSVDSFSIGYRVILSKARKAGDRIVKSLIELALHEISVVTFPCNELAVLTAVKSADEGEALTPENSGILAQIAGLMLAAQRASAAEIPEEGETAPETPAEGDDDPEAGKDAEEGEEAPADASEGENDADEPEDEEVARRAEKAADQLLISMKLDTILSTLRA